jgi:CheY-like chemotaxis protein
MGLLSSPLFRRRHARLLRFGGSKPLVRLGLRGRLWTRLDLRICPRRIAFWRRRSHLGSFRSTPVVDTASDLLNVKTGAYIFFCNWGTALCFDAFHRMGKEKQKQTVLIVDDEPLIRFLVRQILEDAGHEVKEASNADDALSLIAADGITVLLTDIDMPGCMDGLALARDVAARWPNIGVVITSGRRLPGPDDMPRETRFLSKPFSDQRLIDVVDDA